jgi:hypothetical protein
MAIEVMELVRKAHLEKGHKSVLLAMANYASPDGSRVFPGAARLARDTDYSVRWVRKLRKDLVEMGVLVVAQPATWDKPAHYRIDLDVLRSLIERGEVSSPPELSAPTPLNSLHSPPESTSPKPPEEPSVEPPQGVDVEIEEEVEKIYRREIESGKVINFPSNYKAGIRKRVGSSINEAATMKATAEAKQIDVNACGLCGSDGLVAWETEGGGPAGDRCSHSAADYEGLDIIKRQKQEA